MWHDERGTTAVEFAIVAPVFIALLIGTFALCIALFLVGSLHYAVAITLVRACHPRSPMLPQPAVP
ncbi:TadE/TadG family type IV pilus assembly protein [Nitrobacter sp. 62-13]|uniref:TadE/TadG family type IV pilus assembly protein n=1 Tax=Nitrobacter sp. 62-13 TaxID=1895797 RepID=UPI003450A86D